MHRLVLNLLALAILCARTTAEPTQAVQRLRLDPMSVARIPVALDRLTTVRFPGPVSDLQSVLVAVEPHPDALFQVSFQPGNAFFSLRALAAGASTTLNVVWKDQTYVLELAQSRDPWLSVIFEAPPPTAASAPPKPVAPTRLLGLLDTARAFALLRQQYPGSFAGVEVARPNSLHDYGDYTVRIEEVFRFDPEDTLVFRVAVSNKTANLIRYLPESLMVRAGQKLYYESIAEATGILPASAETPFYFAVTGSPDGSRNDLSPKNDFMVLFCRLETPPSARTPPAANAPPQSPACAAPTTRPGGATALCQAYDPTPLRAPDGPPGAAYRSAGPCRDVPGRPFVPAQSPSSRIPTPPAPRYTPAVSSR